jgi:hypothetical protein
MVSLPSFDPPACDFGATNEERENYFCWTLTQRVAQCLRTATISLALGYYLSGLQPLRMEFSGRISTGFRGRIAFT